jgi:CBS domain containing-hemolysin-like protein
VQAGSFQPSAIGVFMRKLNVYTVDHIDHLVQPKEFLETKLSSPALQIFTDFRQYSPSILDASTKALDALEMMNNEHSRLKLVVDAQEEMVGLISTEQLSTQNILQHLSKDVKATDLLVSELMRPRDRIIALSYQQIEHCTVGDVLNTLQHSGEPYCVVIDIENHQIRGVISAKDIADRLHIEPVAITRIPTFLNIFDQLSA